jgi:CBS domain-containing protein
MFEIPDPLRYSAGKVDWAASALPVEGTAAAQPRALDLVRDDVPRARPDARVPDLREQARRTGWNEAVVVNEAGVVLGLVRGEALETPADTAVEGVMDPGPLTIRPSLSLEEVDARFPRGAASVLVTTPDGILLGALRRADLERRLPIVAGTGRSK